MFCIDYLMSVAGSTLALGYVKCNDFLNKDLLIMNTLKNSITINLNIALSLKPVKIVVHSVHI